MKASGSRDKHNTEYELEPYNNSYEKLRKIVEINEKNNLPWVQLSQEEPLKVRNLQTDFQSNNNF